MAGIVLAYALAGRGKRVLLLEAGGYKFSENSQSLYSGANIGGKYFPLDTTRLRYFGGTSNHWTGLRFGLRRPVLDWRLLPLDKKTIHTGAMEVAKYFAPNDIGRVKISEWVFDENNPVLPGLNEGAQVAGNHHIGTTRMGKSEQDGVVDSDCRVFGIGNLYVAGSGVFCTGGHANPTSTIVRLALRLSDHLAKA